MDTIGLTKDEITVLRDVIKSDLNELRTEISHTDDRDFKAALKRRQEIIQAVFEKLTDAAE